MEILRYVAGIMAFAGLGLIMLGAGDSITDETTTDFKVCGIGIALFAAGFVLYQYVRD